MDIVLKLEEILDEARFKKVIRKGKVKRKLFCPKGFKAVGGKCVKMSPEETRKRKRATKRAAKKRKGGVLAKALKKRKKSLRRREQQIHSDPNKAFAAKGLNERIDMWLSEANIPKLKDENDLIKKFNAISKKHLKANSTLADLTDDEFFIWLAGKTLQYGRSFEDSVKNAQNHMKNRKKAESLFGTKTKEDLLGFRG